MERKDRPHDPSMKRLDEVFTEIYKFNPDILSLLWAVDRHKGFAIPFYQTILEEEASLAKISYVQFNRWVHRINGFLVNLEREANNKPYTVTLNEEITDNEGNLDEKLLRKFMNEKFKQYQDESFALLDNKFPKKS